MYYTIGKVSFRTSSKEMFDIQCPYFGESTVGGSTVYRVTSATSTYLYTPLHHLASTQWKGKES